MAALTTYNVVFERLGEWSTEAPPFREAAIEAVLLFDLFRGVLEFDKDSARRQIRAANRLTKVIEGRTDIILRLNPQVKVIVEVKRFNTFDSETKTRDAIRRAAEYIRAMGQEYGIVTDGINWVYFSVKPYRTYHRIYRLVRFNIKKQPDLALTLLKRSRKGTLNHTFKLLTGIHENMTEKEFSKLMDSSRPARVEQLTQKAKMKAKQNNLELEVTKDDKTLLRVLYANDTANQSVKPLVKPIDLTKRKSKK